MLQQPDFKASAGWLNNFFTRHNISYKKCIGEAGLDDKDAAAKYSDDLVALEPSEPTDESEQGQPDIRADPISKQKAIEALNTVKKYFMNSTDDCNEINSIFKLIASVQSKESTKQSKITSFFCLSNKFFLLFVFYSVCVNFFVLS